MHPQDTRTYTNAFGKLNHAHIEDSNKNISLLKVEQVIKDIINPLTSRGLDGFKALFLRDIWVPSLGNESFI